MISPRLLTNGAGTVRSGLSFADGIRSNAVPHPPAPERAARIAAPRQAGLPRIVHTRPSLSHAVALHEAVPYVCGPWKWRATPW
ncbi:hypothetical protein ACIP5N_21755 [Streptomyces sp. NPDC088768]|uniref:hypothetical protein n=1 Tax=Streptomyces sp. NPDC088768 TaxID=3365894 RepID=UPI0038138D19